MTALPANTPAQAETWLHSREEAAAGIGLHVNAHKTEYLGFNQRGDISTLNKKFFLKKKFLRIIHADLEFKAVQFNQNLAFLTILSVCTDWN